LALKAFISSNLSQNIGIFSSVPPILVSVSVPIPDSGETWPMRWHTRHQMVTWWSNLVL